MNNEELRDWIIKNLYNDRGYLHTQKISHFSDMESLIVNSTYFLNTDASIIQRCWHIVNEIFENVLCPVCGNDASFRDYTYGYNKYCSFKCSNRCKDKRRKIANSKLERYGDENYNNRVKFKGTCGNRYPDSPYNNPEKTKQTKFETYGDETFVNPEKYKDTCIEKYGVEHYSQTPDFKIKIKETTFKNYGVYNPSQSPQIFECNNNYKNSWHSYTMPSGKEIKLQGYEPRAMDILLSSYNEDEIIFKRTNVPEIWYLKSEDNKWHRYFCDFYIPKDNLIVEVKSKYTYENHLITNLDKQDACLQLGYNYRLVIL